MLDKILQTVIVGCAAAHACAYYIYKNTGDLDVRERCCDIGARTIVAGAPTAFVWTLVKIWG